MSKNGGVKDSIVTAIDGFCMSVADSVPGVSGGTVALIMGFYKKFIDSTHDIFFTKGKQRLNALKYLIKLGIGLAAGMILSVLVITAAFEKHVYPITSLFLGFVIASIPMLVRQQKESLQRKKGSFIFLFIGIAVVVVITLLTQNRFSAGIDFSNLSVGLGFYIFIGAIFSTAAMFLPGISGSSLLLIIGLYLPVMSAGRNLLHLKFNYLLGMMIFAAGIVVGALTIVKVINFCMSKYESQTMYTIVGLMIGSVFSIIMGPSTIAGADGPLTFDKFNWWMFFIGIGIILIIDIFGSRRLKGTRIK